MPCDRVPRRMVEGALDKLRRALREHKARLKVDRVTGAVAFAGARDWAETGQGRVGDLCAYRKLLVSGSAELRTAIMDAERLAGRKVNAAAVAAGVHSHDGGATFGGGA